MKIWILYGSGPNAPTFHSLAAWNYAPAEEEENVYKEQYPRTSYYVDLIDVITKENE